MRSRLFFHDLMSVRYKDFGDVRTAGNLGDMGSDGHSFYNGKLYACYAPQVFNKDKLKEKFDGDLAKAKAKRDGQFEIFVFVHNERSGMHPQVSSMVAQATVSHKPIKFENFGFRRFRDEFMRLDRSEVEDRSCSSACRRTRLPVGTRGLPLRMYRSPRWLCGWRSCGMRTGRWPTGWPSWNI